MTHAALLADIDDALGGRFRGGERITDRFAAAGELFDRLRMDDELEQRERCAGEQHAEHVTEPIRPAEREAGRNDAEHAAGAGEGGDDAFFKQPGQFVGEQALGRATRGGDGVVELAKGGDNFFIGAVPSVRFGGRSRERPLAGKLRGAAHAEDFTRVVFDGAKLRVARFQVGHQAGKALLRLIALAVVDRHDLEGGLLPLVRGAGFGVAALGFRRGTQRVVLRLDGAPLGFVRGDQLRAEFAELGVDPQLGGLECDVRIGDGPPMPLFDPSLRSGGRFGQLELRPMPARRRALQIAHQLKLPAGGEEGHCVNEGSKDLTAKDAKGREKKKKEKGERE